VILSAGGASPRSSEESPDLRPVAPRRPELSVGLHIPAIVVIFEHEACPKLFSTHGKEGAALVVEWLRNAHPEWSDRVLLPAADVLEEMLDEEQGR
jgi:hypothetical protein